jgi:protein-arginine kinase activator protein McsA
MSTLVVPPVGSNAPRSTPLKLHFFPLPAPPRWNRIEVSGAQLPPCAAASLTALNQDRTLLLYGGIRGQTPTTALHPHPGGICGSGTGGVNTSVSGVPSGAAGLAGSSALPLQACGCLSSDFYLLDASTGRCQGMGPRFGGEVGHTARVGHAALAIDPHTLLVTGGWNGRRYVTSSLLVDLRNKQTLFEATTSLAPVYATGSSNRTIIGMTPSLRPMPPPRRDHALVRVGKSQLYLIGGWDGEDCMGDVWVCRIQRVSNNTHVNMPSAAQSTLSKSGSGGDGGRDESLTSQSNSTHTSSDVNHSHSKKRFHAEWVWSPFQLAPTSPYPSPRRGHSAVVIGGSASKKIILFGGMGGYSSYKNDLHILDTETKTWSSPPPSAFGGTIPSPRAWHSASAIAHTDYMIVFGGSGPAVHGKTGFLNDLHLLDTKALRWYALVQSSVQSEEALAQVSDMVAPASGLDCKLVPLPPPHPPSYSVNDLPGPRSAHAACMVGSKLYIQGGFVPTPIHSSAVHTQPAGMRTDTITAVLPSTELFELETFLPAEVLYPPEIEEACRRAEDDEEEQIELLCAEDESDDEEEEGTTDDPTAHTAHVNTIDDPLEEGDEDAEESDHSERSSPVASVKHRRSITLSDAPSSVPFLATEGWLAVAHAPPPITSGAATARLPVVPSVWSRRFVRLEKNSLLAYHPEPRMNGMGGGTSGIALVEKDGLVKLWIDVHAELAASLLARDRSAHHPSHLHGGVDDWLAAEAASAGMTSLMLPASGMGGGSTSNAAISQLHGQLLARLLSDASSGGSNGRYAQFASFLRSKHAEGLLLFCTDAERFRTSMESRNHQTGSSEDSSLRAQARAIFDSFLAPGSSRTNEISVPTSMVNEVKATLQRLGLISGQAAPLPATGAAATLPANLFQPALLHVLATLRATWMPKYLQFIATPAQLALAAQQQQKWSGGNAGAKDAASFTLKLGLTEEDRNEPCCEHCLTKFTSKTTKHRLFCAYCHGVFCDRCTQNLTALPAEYQRLVGGSVTRIRVCDPCEHVLAARNREGATGVSSANVGAHMGGTSNPSPQPKTKRLFAFSYTSRRTNQPIHLASESSSNAVEWVAALKELVSANSTIGIVGIGTGSSPEKGNGINSNSFQSISHDREGWLMAEEGTSKVWKRVYVVLRGNQLSFFDLLLKKTFMLRTDTGIRIDPDQSQDSAESVAARGAAAAAALTNTSGVGVAPSPSPTLCPVGMAREFIQKQLQPALPQLTAAELTDPSLWPVLYPFTVGNEENSTHISDASTTSPTNGAASAGSNVIVFAAASSSEREHWIRQLSADVRALRHAAGLTSTPISLQEVGFNIPIQPAATKHPRVRSVSTPFNVHNNNVTPTTSHSKGNPAAALALLSSLAASRKY